MKKMLLGIAILLLITSVGCKQKPEQSLQLTIKSDKEVYELGEDVTLPLTIKNISSKQVNVPQLIWSSKVIINGREYSRRPEYIGNWNGPAVILSGTEMFTAIGLSSYDITDGTLVVGKHDIALKIDIAISNTITIEVVEKKESIASQEIDAFAQEILTDCPECKVRLNKVPIVYGMPSPEMGEQAERGEIILGGCVFSECAPNYVFVCPKCKEEIGRYYIDDKQAHEE